MDINNIKNLTAEDRAKLFSEYASSSYTGHVDEINENLKIKLFNIIDFNELKRIRDNIAITGKLNDKENDNRGFFATTIQTYIRMLYAITLYGKDNLKKYNPNTKWHPLIKDLKKDGLIEDDTYHSSTPSSKGPSLPVGDKVPYNPVNSPFSDSAKINTFQPKSSYAAFDIDLLIQPIADTGLFYDDNLVKRYVASLLTKPFVILSGLAGSGKTQLALAVAHVLSEKVDEQLCFVAVGADWTNREPLLGYPNALKPTEYIKPENGVLDILLRAQKDPSRPYFLVLDEMNLSYVERYFADFLSAMESKKGISLWNVENSDVPTSVTLPRNLFITGTINVDETTYMFSPKVLDRANVIEFKINEKEMSHFLGNIRPIDLTIANGSASQMAQDFVIKAINKEYAKNDTISSSLLSFFKELKKVNAEFGYRTASEIFCFIKNALDLGLTDDEAIDASIVQKLLPKLHGSKKQVENALKQLWKACLKESGGEPLKIDSEANSGNCKYLLSADKILRMFRTACNNGFTSFAEA